MVQAKGTATARLVLVAMTLANSMILVDQTAVPLALPAIMKDFGVQSQAVQWVLNASLLPLAGLLVFGGRIGDLLGRRRMFLLGLVVFANYPDLASPPTLDHSFLIDVTRAIRSARADDDGTLDTLLAA